jgi:hypothetical protein
MLTLLLGACSTPQQSTASSHGKKVRYVTLPPETGSIIPRRVAVSDQGSPEELPANAQQLRKSEMDKLQRTTSAGLNKGP